VIAATFDPGFPGFHAEKIAGSCRERGWEHHTVSLNIPAILEEKKYTQTPCVLCSRLRRGKLYGLARELGCGKLALGQHFDDIAVSFLMSLFRGQGLPIFSAAWTALDVNDPPLEPMKVAPEDEPREGIERRNSKGKEWREEYAED
jgi:tRNA 2-thiocytidine biosynthesis protein TtcA